MDVPGTSTLVAPRMLPIDRWPLRGGVACLEFANTVGWRPEPRAFDGLSTYDDLLVWSRHAGVISCDEFDRLRARALQDALAASEVLRDAIRLREAIYRLFVALARGHGWNEDDLATINQCLVEGMTHSKLSAAPDGFTFHVPEAESLLELPHWRIAKSAAQLLLSGDWRRVRECPGHDCGWLFLDQTKNGNRRWCDSADCGNRARVRAHKQRRRERDRSQMRQTAN